MPALFNYSMSHRIVNTEALLRYGPKHGLCFGPCFGTEAVLRPVLRSVLRFRVKVHVRVVRVFVPFLVRFGPCVALGLRLMTSGYIAMAL